VGINDFDEIFLVDDEITTGNSMLNIIFEISKISNIKNFSILSILDWRTEENISKYKKMEEENNIKINLYSLISGTVSTNDNTIYEEDTLENEKSEKNDYIDLSNIFEKINLNTVHR